jgi:hypothetical protein
MLEASTEMICPIQTMVNPSMPDGRLAVSAGEASIRFYAEKNCNIVPIIEVFFKIHHVPWDGVGLHLLGEGQ